ncbi:hypothetical protein LPJ61_004775 [Coemansia biformis]|uniref:Uncharacterized protein n=1 Tax=Coemansia biformis TaxID=1286918 RepID=A0A9W7Y8M5_9FUNG|nr:hypothetical protein LPJ61_004775 [Coemansia biformis]
MKVPFFRPRAKDHDATSTSTASSKTQQQESPPQHPAALAASDTMAGLGEPRPSQLGEMQALLSQIGGFQGEVRRLFPENMALDRMLGELRDECQRRVDYMARVSAQHAWMGPQQQQQQQQSSLGPQQQPSLATLSTAEVPGTPKHAAPSRRHLFAALTGSAQAKTANLSASTTTVSNTDDSSGSSSSGSSSGNESIGHRYERAQRTAPTRVRHSVDPQTAAATYRELRGPDRRRKTAPQSVLLASMPADRPQSASGARSPSHAAMSPSTHPRTSMAISSPDPPRLPRLRTSSIDALPRPQSLAVDPQDASAASSLDMPRLSLIGSPRASIMAARPLNSAGDVKQRPVNSAGDAKQRPQHMPAAASRSTNDYLVKLRVAGTRIEAAVSPSLQTSLISMQLATTMGMPITRMPTNTRVWSSGGKSWQVVGQVAGLPFACGNMTFTHNFKVVNGSAAANDLIRDVVLGNDFCVGNKGRIKDNRLHLENLCMPVSVPVRQVIAS